MGHSSVAHSQQYGEWHDSHGHNTFNCRHFFSIMICVDRLFIVSFSTPSPGHFLNIVKGQESLCPPVFSRVRLWRESLLFHTPLISSAFWSCGPSLILAVTTLFYEAGTYNHSSMSVAANKISRAFDVNWYVVSGPRKKKDLLVTAGSICTNQPGRNTPIWWRNLYH